MRKNHIIKTAVLLVLLIGIGMSIAKVGKYKGEMVLGTERYTARFGEKKGSIDLAKEIKINNKYSLNAVPEINIGGKGLVLTPAPAESSEFKAEKGSYSISLKAKEKNSKIKQKFRATEKYLEVKTRATNTGGKKKKIFFQYSFSPPSNGTVFYPNAVNNNTKSYAVLTDGDKKGLSLGLTTNAEIKGKKAFASKTSLNIHSSKIVKPGGTFSLKVKVTPLNIWTGENDLEFPEKHSPYLENPLFSVKGDKELDLNGTAESKISQALTQLKGEGNGSVESFSDLDLSKKPYNSLEATIAMKKACAEEKIPCKIVIGKLGKEKYGWIKTFNKGEWKDVDPFKGTKTRPSDYEILYEEPSPQFVSIKGSKITGEKYLSSTAFLKPGGGAPTLLYLVVILGIGGGAISILYMYSGEMIESLSSEEEEEVKERTINGEYEILSEKDDIENESGKPVFEKIVEEDGEVDTDRYSEEIGYSEEFIKHSINYLREEGHIKKEEEELEEEKEEAKEETKEVSPVEKILNSLKPVSRKIGVTPLQLLLILIVLIGGAVTIALLLLM